MDLFYLIIKLAESFALSAFLCTFADEKDKYDYDENKELDCLWGLGPDVCLVLDEAECHQRVGEFLL